MKKKKKIFIDGAIAPDFIANSIAKHQHKTEVGAHNIFLGQVREDEKEEGKVIAIDFSAHEEMAEDRVHTIREETFERFDLSCMHIYHSLGRVELGQVCFFVFVSAPHRDQVYEATEYLEQRIKAEVPIFGNELLDSGTHVWKKNRMSGSV